jgi:uncharacterized membrane protein
MGMKRKWKKKFKELLYDYWEIIPITVFFLLFFIGVSLFMPQLIRFFMGVR